MSEISFQNASTLNASNLSPIIEKQLGHGFEAQQGGRKCIFFAFFFVFFCCCFFAFFLHLDATSAKERVRQSVGFYVKGVVKKYFYVACAPPIQDRLGQFLMVDDYFGVLTIFIIIAATTTTTTTIIITLIIIVDVVVVIIIIVVVVVIIVF
jgi:hypothetical protein